MFQERREAKKSKNIRKSAGGMFQNELSLPTLLQNTAFPAPSHQTCKTEDIQLGPPGNDSASSLFFTEQSKFRF